MAEKYLVPIDFSSHSDAALDYARKLARDRRARLILIHVIPAAEVNGRNNIIAEYYGMLKRDAGSQIAKLVNRKKLKPREYDVVVTHGLSPGAVIAREAKRLKVDMIIMGSHGRSDLRRLLLGSVAERTLRCADRPILVVKKKGRLYG